MLKLTPIATFATTVKVRLPTEKPNVFNEGEFTARYRFVSPERFTEIMDGIREIGSEDEEGNRQVPTTREVTNYQLSVLDEVLDGVEGIGDGDGTAYEPSKQREMVLSNFALRVAVFDSFFSGYRAAPAKNSKRSPKR